MKKLLIFGLVSALSASVFMGGGNASAQTSAEQMTEDYTINWDSVWDNLDTYKEEVNFGNASDPSSVSASGLGSLATGSTGLSSTSTAVTSTGKTKGRVLSTYTSATTSVRDIVHAVTSNGGKRMAVGTFTATSKASIGNFSGKTPFSGVTVHTATSKGKIYSSNTGNTKAF
ncbi:hypothetical protein ACR0S4_28615 [Priestia megaterium]|uniref:hypothetical protein n=1 Tax=Priestia megaterium TaxID=1404 RepID=UPI003D99616F